MTPKELASLGFTLQSLPDGRVNIMNKNPFVLNGLTTIVCHRGTYFLTTNCKSIQDFSSYIKTLEML